MTAEAVKYSVNPRQRRGLLASALCVAVHRRWRSGHHLVVASGTASRCRPLLHPSPGRGPGLTESESALRTSITTSLHSPPSHLRSIRTHHLQLRIIDCILQLHRTKLGGWPRERSRLQLTPDSVGGCSHRLYALRSIAADAQTITDIISSRRLTRAATRFEDALLP